MDNPQRYVIRVQGQLTRRWSEWFDGMTLQNDSEDETTLRGWVSDQAALFGLLRKIYDLNLPLLSVHRLTADE